MIGKYLKNSDIFNERGYNILKKITAFTLFLIFSLAMQASDVVEIQNSTVTTSKSKLLKEYVCSTIGTLSFVASVVFTMRTLLGFTAVLFANSLSPRERSDEFKANFLIGLPLSIILFKTADFFSKLAKT